MRPKKKKKSHRSDFIIDEADVDEDAEDEEDAWEDADVGVDVLKDESEEAGRSARDIEARMRKKGRDSRFGFDDDQMDAEEIEEYYRQKYNESNEAVARFGKDFHIITYVFQFLKRILVFLGEGGVEMSDEITQQTLLPGVKDPNLWMVKCVLGMEKETVLRIMNKYLAYQHTEEPLQIR